MDKESERKVISVMKIFDCVVRVWRGTSDDTESAVEHSCVRARPNGSLNSGRFPVQYIVLSFGLCQYLRITGNGILHFIYCVRNHNANDNNILIKVYIECALCTIRR